MKSRTEVEYKLAKLKPYLFQKYFVNKIGYFGSFSRDEQTENSDIDILVSFKKSPGWEFFDLQELLEKELNRKVDLVSENALKRQLKDSIIKNVLYI